MRDWLYNWQTLIGAVFASLVAGGSAVFAWKAAMRQTAAIQSERDRRSKYAAGLALSYLAGVKQIVLRVQREEKRLAAITEDAWKHDPEKLLVILRSAQSAFTEATGSPQSEDVEQYREELPLSLFGSLRLVFRLQNDLANLIGELVAQQNIYSAFPLADCQAQLRDGVSKIRQAIDGAEQSFDRFKYE